MQVFDTTVNGAALLRMGAAAVGAVVVSMALAMLA